MLETEKIEENWFTHYFSNDFERQKIAQNKTTRFGINPKSVYTSHNERFGENSVSFCRKKLLPLAGIYAKIHENGFNVQE